MAQLDFKQRNRCVYIEWEQKILNPGKRRIITRLTALLVERGDGDPGSSSRVVARLGSIEERYLNANIRTLREFHQGLFWQVVNKRLDRLELQPGIRETVEREIHGKVPSPGGEWALWSVTCIPHYDCKIKTGG